MLRSGKSRPQLSKEELKITIDCALKREQGARFLYNPKLFEKLGNRKLSIHDLLCVCRGWEVFRSARYEKGSWRYRIEGYNTDGKWMAAVISVRMNPTVVVAITGFRFSRGEGKR